MQYGRMTPYRIHCSVSKKAQINGPNFMTQGSVEGPKAGELSRRGDLSGSNAPWESAESDVEHAELEKFSPSP